MESRDRVMNLDNSQILQTYFRKGTVIANNNTMISAQLNTSRIGESDMSDSTPSEVKIESDSSN